MWEYTTRGGERKQPGVEKTRVLHKKCKLATPLRREFRFSQKVETNLSISIPRLRMKTARCKKGGGITSDNRLRLYELTSFCLLPVGWIVTVSNLLSERKSFCHEKPEVYTIVSYLLLPTCKRNSMPLFCVTTTYAIRDKQDLNPPWALFYSVSM